MGLLNAVVAFEIAVLDPPALMGDVIADRWHKLRRHIIRRIRCDGPNPFGMARQVFIGEHAINFQHAGAGAIGKKVVQKGNALSIKTNHQFLRLAALEQQPHQRPTMLRPLGKAVFKATKVRQLCILFAEEVIGGVMSVCVLIAAVSTIRYSGQKNSMTGCKAC